MNEVASTKLKNQMTILCDHVSKTIKHMKLNLSLSYKDIVAFCFVSRPCCDFRLMLPLAEVLHFVENHHG